MQSQHLTKPLSVAVSPELYEKLRALAFKNRVTIGKLVREAIWKMYWAGEYFMEVNSL